MCIFVCIHISFECVDKVIKAFFIDYFALAALRLKREGREGEERNGMRSSVTDAVDYSVGGMRVFVLCA